MAESIIRIKRRSGFTVLPNSTLRDNRLSLKTRAILAIMLSVPDDWDYTVSGLAVVCGASRDTVGTALRELEANGYLTRRQTHDSSGCFGRNEYTVTDEPAGTAGAPLPENPSTAEPLTAEPLTENPAQQNKDYTNTPYNPPEGESRQAQKGRKPDWDLFEQFWKAYPKKKDKEKARQVWRRLKPDLELCLVMSAALERDKQSENWREQNGKFVPYPAKWLRGRRWEDEPTASPASGGPALPEGGRWL